MGPHTSLCMIPNKFDALSLWPVKGASVIFQVNKIRKHHMIQNQMSLEVHLYGAPLGVSRLYGLNDNAKGI